MPRFRSVGLVVFSICLCFPNASRAQEIPRGFQGSTNPHIEKWAYLLSASKWPDPVIYVCWENPSESNESERKWVQQAINATWQKASALQFKGWGSCAIKVEGR